MPFPKNCFHFVVHNVHKLWITMFTWFAGHVCLNFQREPAWMESLHCAVNEHGRKIDFFKERGRIRQRKVLEKSPSKSRIINKIKFSRNLSVALLSERAAKCRQCRSVTDAKRFSRWSPVWHTVCEYVRSRFSLKRSPLREWSSIVEKFAGSLPSVNNPLECC